jgi:hypothetical protein
MGLCSGRIRCQHPGFTSSENGKFKSQTMEIIFHLIAKMDPFCVSYLSNIEINDIFLKFFSESYSIIGVV